MTQINDNPGQGNRGGQEYGEDSRHKSSRNDDSQRHQTTPEEEMLKREQGQDPENNDDKFSPADDESHDAEDFVTD